MLGFNLLVLSPGDGFGEKVPLQPFIIELLKRGHQIIHVTSKTHAEPKSQNYSEVLFNRLFYTQADGKIGLFIFFFNVSIIKISIFS